jgi:exodeoxyribonuclease V gamma subunit
VLTIHRAERADGLAAALGDLLIAPLEDPLAPEVVAVPTRGVERWLSQTLSARLGAGPGGGDGVCANVDFPFPARLVGGAVADAAGVDREADPWLPERTVWPLLALVDGLLAEPWLGPLAAHLGGPGDGADPARRARRFAAVRHAADLFDRYAVHRPAMVRAWAGGADVDGSGAPLPEDARWQPELWRRLRARLDLPSPAERLEAACDRLRTNPALAALPARLSLFGLTRLPASYLDVLTALAAGREVHLFLLHPSIELWRRVAREAARRPASLRRAEDRTAEVPANPLLASWGRDAREMQLALTAAGGFRDDPRPLGPAPPTLLGRLQADVRADRPPPGPPLPGAEDARPPLDPGDRSLQIHACHGRARQVEVLRDAILHMLDEDPSLEPRDVIVMCPDIEAFAPLVHAAFGAAESEDGGEGGDAPVAGVPPDLRVRLADRSLRQTNPLLGVVARLLELATGRLTASELLDLAAREPVRRRFGLDDDDLTRLEEWVAATGIRWGLDAAHRRPFKLDVLDSHTWRAGLDRVLLGVAMSEERRSLVGGVLPLDDVEGSAIDLAGRLAELVDRLEEALEGLSRARPLQGWTAAIAEAADMLTLTPERDAWQRAELGRLLDEVSDEAGTAACAGGPELTPPEVAALLADRLRGRPTRANFRTGHLTVCTLVPMRSVPHRVVCLLGLDDGVFPRIPARDGDDVMLADPHVGDRDARGEDRQLLLDALLAAGDRLVIAYTGRDERTNAERPPAVPVGELLDVVDRTVRAPDGARAREAVLVRHPLQPFDPRNFRAGALVHARPWSFDPVALAGARALCGDRVAPGPFLAGRLPPAPAEPLELERLLAFVRHPVRAFLRARLGVSLADWSDEVDDALPITLDPLARWAVGTRLLEARLAGADRAACEAAELARGVLPPGAFGREVLNEVAPAVEAVAEAARALVPPAAEPGSVEVNLRLPDGRPLVGSAPDVHGDLLRTVSFSKLGAGPRLVAWVRLLAVTAAHPERPFAAATIGRARQGAPRGSRVTVARIPPLAPDPDGRRRAALAGLAALVDLHDRGMREPLPLYRDTSAAYACAAAAGHDPAAAARAAWESGWEWPREDAEAEHVLVLGGVRTIEELLSATPAADEGGVGWAADEASRLGLLARRLWDGLLAVEELVDA